MSADGADRPGRRERPDRTVSAGRARALAPAKINPFLDVLSQRSDGFHEVRTFLVAVDLCDEIEARVHDRGGVTLAMTGPAASSDVPADEHNLAWRAASACLDHARAHGLAAVDAGVDLLLEKNIPSQSGLGGASSDAAAAWMATAAALGIRDRVRGTRDADGEGDDATALATARDDALARLGSDTVFFARAAASGAAWCTGRGEIVEPARAPRGWSIALVTPAVTAPTASVYARLGIPLREPGPLPSLKPVDWSSIPARVARDSLTNRLEQAALSAIDGLREWRVLLDDAGGAHFRLSGSGSSFFGLYDDDDEARTMLATVARLSHARGLSSRFCDLVHPSGHGARVLMDP